MKKKTIITTAILTCALACACGGGGAVENAEYNEYATQVRTVMYNLGLSTYNPEMETAETLQLVNQGEYFNSPSASATFDNNKTALFNLAQGYADKVERDTLSAYTNVFEQSFYIPLIMGKALADHYKVSTFYGVCANSPWNQYVQTVKDGSVKTTKVYTPAGEVFEQETFIEMALDYTDKDNYEIRVKQCSVDYSRVYFVYADGESFLEISYEQGNGENCYVSYSLDGFSGFNCKDEATSLQAKNLIVNEFTGIDQVAMRNIKKNAKYTVDEEKWEEANGYFFNGNGDGITQIPYGWADENQTVLSSYRCFETTKRIEIPARVRYLTDSFSIEYDEGVEPCEELVIPKTVIGIKGYNRNEDPNPNPEPTLPQLIDLTAKDLRIQTWNWEPLKNIVVEEGSTLFASGEGHLRALDGEVVCYINKAHPTGKANQTDFMHGGKLSYDLLDKYPLLTQSITELVCDERYLGEIGMLVRQFSAIRTLHVSFPDPMGEEMRSLQLEATGDLELYLYAKGVYAIDYAGPGTLTVRLQEKDVRLNIHARESIVYSKWNKVECAYMEAKGQPICSGATTVYYEDDGDTSFTGISFENQYYGLEMVLDTVQASAFTVPQTCFNETIQYVRLVNSVNTPVSVTLPATVQELRIDNTWAGNGTFNYGNNITIAYDGDKTAFYNVLKSGYESPQYVNVVCNDYTGKISGFVQKVTLVNEGAGIIETHYLFTGGDTTITGKSVVPSYSEDKRYYYTDENGNRYNVTNASDLGGSLYVECPTFYDPADITLTYHEEDNKVALEIYLASPDLAQALLVFEGEVSIGTHVYVQNDGTGKLLVVIEPNNNGTNNPMPNESILMEMPMGMSYKGDSEFIIENDTYLELQLR